MFLREAASSYLHIQVKLLFYVLCKFRVQERFVAKSALEEHADTFHITIEIANGIGSVSERNTQHFKQDIINSLFSVGMRSRDHLGKVNEDRLSCVFEQNVEFVEITMNEAMLS